MHLPVCTVDHDVRRCEISVRDLVVVAEHQSSNDLLEEASELVLRERLVAQELVEVQSMHELLSDDSLKVRDPFIIFFVLRPLLSLVPRHYPH